jgi:hypothetical protein
MTDARPLFEILAIAAVFVVVAYAAFRCAR